MSRPIIPHLKGETPHSEYGFERHGGELSEGAEYVFPLFKAGADGVSELVGTVFFINRHGVFCTAKHVIEDILDKDLNQTHSLYTCQLDSKQKKYWLRKVNTVSMHEVADIAVGVLDPVIEGDGILENGHLIINVTNPPVGAEVSTYAHPQTSVENGEAGPRIYVAAKDFAGRVVEHYSPIRDRIRMPYRCFQTSINVYGGASGGPVFYEGTVVGVNTSSFDGCADCSFITPIGYIFDLAVSEMIVGGTKYECHIPIPELVRRRFIPCVPYNMEPANNVRKKFTGVRIVNENKKKRTKRKKQRLRRKAGIKNRKK